jgi:general secretion pathway protein M
VIVRIRTRYDALSARERWLVSFAVVLAAIVMLVFGVILPLGRAQDAAHERHAAAVQASSRLLAQLAALDAPPPRRMAMAGPVAQVVAASADAAGFVLQSNQPRGTDAALIVVPTARPSAALAWLDTLAAQGIVLESLTMTPAPDGSVAVNATVRRAAP